MGEGYGTITPPASTGPFSPTSIGIGVTPSATSGTIASAPLSSNAVNTALSTQVALGTAWHNTLDYDVLLHFTMVVTAATTATVLGGVGPTNTPSQNNICGSFSLPTVISLTFTVPTQQWLLVNTGGASITVASVTTFLQAL